MLSLKTGSNAMTTTAIRPIEQGAYRFNTGEVILWERETDTSTLPAGLAAAAPDQWIWCFDCERAFQLEDAREGDQAHCPYVDCAALPVSFWKWESYRSFSGAHMVPIRDRMFPLAAAA